MCVRERYARRGGLYIICCWLRAAATASPNGPVSSLIQLCKFLSPSLLFSRFAAYVFLFFCVLCVLLTGKDLNKNEIATEQGCLFG